MRKWSNLSQTEQLDLRETYGRDPTCQSQSCSMEAKLSQFTEWLAAQGVDFTADDLKR